MLARPKCQSWHAERKSRTHGSPSAAAHSHITRKQTPQQSRAPSQLSKHVLAAPVGSYWNTCSKYACASAEARLVYWLAAAAVAGTQAALKAPTTHFQVNDAPTGCCTNTMSDRCGSPQRKQPRPYRNQLHSPARGANPGHRLTRIYQPQIYLPR